MPHAPSERQLFAGDLQAIHDAVTDVFRAGRSQDVRGDTPLHFSFSDAGDLLLLHQYTQVNPRKVGRVNPCSTRPSSETVPLAHPVQYV